MKKEQIELYLENQLLHVNSKLMRYERIGHIVIAKDEWTPANNLLTPTLKVKRRTVEQYYSNLIQSTLTQSQRIVWE